MDGIVDAGLAFWPLALTLASVTVVDRVRAARRRQCLNRALHELRRPLQALLLGRSHANGAAGQIEMALVALGQLDTEINGHPQPARRWRVVVRDVLAASVERWSAMAAIAGRGLELGSCPVGASVVCDPGRLSQALDNLIANALEHGRGRIRVDAVRTEDSIVIVVSDGWRVAPGADMECGAVRVRRTAPSRFGWRGHGLPVVAAVAADHGGRVDVRHGVTGTCVTLELPAGPG